MSSQYLLIEVGFPINKEVTMYDDTESQYLLIEVGFPIAPYPNNE